MGTPLASVEWIHGAPDCAQSTDPLIQVHQFDQDTVIMRVSKCYVYEGNFIYLLFGTERAVLLDTGPQPGKGNEGKVLPIRTTVDSIITRWLERRGIRAIDLVVAHTHSHPDHVFWDKEFEERARTTIVQPNLAAVEQYFALPHWPNGRSDLNLGGRKLTIFPIPGHEAAHIAAYDSRTKVLLTGDMLYPGLLTIEDWPAYRKSAARLANFAEQHEVSLVLGTHIEMQAIPTQLYPIGTTYQPDEHALPLAVAHINELDAACKAMASMPNRDVHDDFIIGNDE
jgi:hydroxyacylglutathione hydrolase